MTTTNDLFGEPIHAYTRDQALADGVLVALDPKLCKEAGFKYHVAVTRRVFDTCVDLTDMAKEMCNDIAGRQWDVLWMLRDAVKRQRESTTEMLFEFYCVINRRRPQKVRLKSVCGPADDGSPCITIMYPDED